MTDLTSFIIYESDDIMALNKPAGIVVHGDGRTKEESVSAWLVEKYPDVKGVGEMIRLENKTNEDGTITEGAILDRSGVVHRLDRDTSGVLLLAKTQAGFEHLKSQFLERTIQKTYFAFVYGNVKEDHGTINQKIGKSPTDFRKYSAGRGAFGMMRDATTYYQVLKRGEDESVKDGSGIWTLVEARPKTGRTHQIRVHFLAMQRPVVCDKLYAASKPSLLGFNRLALHARKVEFTDMNGEPKTLIADFPEDFKHAFEEISYKPR